jgi:hypothetical protein
MQCCYYYWFCATLEHDERESCDAAEINSIDMVIHVAEQRVLSNATATMSYM